MPLSRRNFFTQSGLFTAGAVALSTEGYAADSRSWSRWAGVRPGRIIHMVSDGMSAGTLTCADHLSHIVRHRPSTWMELYKHPASAHGLMNMRSLNSLVTDSSAASSSWGCGSRIMNGAVNVLPDGRQLTPLYTLFGQKGWKRGLVTTTEITHATPAGFAANDESRGSAEAIAVQYFERRIDLMLGGGSKFFTPDKREDKRNLLADFSTAGYSISRTADELRKAPRNKPWLGLFAESHVPFTVDHLRDEKLMKSVPSLAEMTHMALDKFSRESNFILQVEGGRVDHGCHSCDATGALYDQLAFDEAIDVCLAFQKRHPDTLIVMTTDHGNGNLGLNGMGDSYNDSSRLFANLTQVKASFSTITKKLEKVKTAKEVTDIIADTTGFKIKADEAEVILPFIEKKGKTLYSAMNSLTAQLGQLLGDYLGIGWTSGAHTGDFVPILAIGPGAEKFGGFVQNTDVFTHYLKFAKIDFRNPALPLRAEGPSAGHVEKVEEYGWV
jgi:alkaline phosphatase